MKVENTSMRLKQIMLEERLKQVDILEKCKPFCEKYGITMNKSDISQYISGKTEPGSKKLTILALALGVTETWLMGYDVPMRPESSGNSEPEKNTENDQIKDKDLIVLYRKLEKVPDEERQMMIEQFNSSIDVFLKRKGLID